MSEKYQSGKGPLLPDPPADTLTLDAMAVVETYADAHRRGEAPVLSEWLQRYPEHAEALADYAAASFAEPETNLADVEAESTGALSPGTQRALDVLFSATPELWPESPLLRMAETPASYDARPVGILALAHERGLDVEQVARMVDLSPQLVAWLDRTPIHQDQQPNPLVQRLAQALSVSADAIERALAVAGDVAIQKTPQGANASESISVEEAVRSARTLSAAQRPWWLAILNQEDTNVLDIGEE